MPQTLCQWTVLVGIVAAGVLVSAFVHWVFMGKLLETNEVARKALKALGETQAVQTEQKRKYTGFGLQQWVGALEIIIYASCVVFQHLEFIAVWFATKYIAVYRNWGEDPVGRTFYNRSLFGSGLNVLLGFATGEVARWAICRIG